MSVDTFERLAVEHAPEDPRRRFAPGVLTSGLAHGLALLLLLLGFGTVTHPERDQLHTVFIDIVHLGETTESPPAPQKSPTPQQQAFARKAPAAHSPNVGVRPNPKPVVHDDFLNRLNSLSKLHAPETDTQALHGQGESKAESTSNDATPGDEATYSLRDYIRAQILRRWNLDLSANGAHSIIVALHVVMKSNGTIASAEIVDKHRYATDAAFRQIAMSARNAILLASPINLPPGNYAPETAMTLSLNPRDVLH
ncbi:MAG: hypothetical protein WDM89_19780 [Rhizomicrobium sp.]